MNPVLKRLQDYYSENFDALSDDITSIDLTISSKMDDINPAFFARIYPQHLVLNLEYSVLRQQLHCNILTLNADNTHKIREQLIAALMLAELLEHLYLYYLDVPREVLRIRADKKEYKKILVRLGVNIPLDEEDIKKDNEKDLIAVLIAVIKDAIAALIALFNAQQVRDTTINSNWYRLVFGRSIRLFTLIQAMGATTELFSNFVASINLYGGLVVPYISAFFYFPRFFMNIGILIKHTIPGSWMSEEEQSLLWTDRFFTHVKRRWFELANDSAWMFLGLINCFLMVGPLAPFSVYLAVLFFTYDVLVSAYRAHLEHTQIANLQKEYAQMLSVELDPVNRQAIEEYQLQLTRRRNFETMRLGLSIASTLSIVLAACCALPIFVACPIIPLTGALWLVVICVINFALSRILDHFRPIDTVEEKGMPNIEVTPPVTVQEAPSRAYCSFFSRPAPPAPESPQEHELNWDLGLHIGSSYL